MYESSPVRKFTTPLKRPLTIVSAMTEPLDAVYVKCFSRQLPYGKHSNGLRL